MILNRLSLPADNPMLVATKARVDRSFDLIDARARDAKYSGRRCIHRGRYHDRLLADDDALLPALRSRPLSQHQGLSRPHCRRPAYRRAMEKGDPGMALLLT